MLLSIPGGGRSMSREGQLHVTGGLDASRQAMLQMKKIDIEGLRRAYAGGTA